MKRILLAFLMLCCLVACGCSQEKPKATVTASTAYTSAADFFGPIDYVNYQKNLKLNGKEYRFSFHPISPGKAVFDRAILFPLGAEEQPAELVIIESRVINRKGEVIIDLSKLPYKFYGYTFSFSYPEDLAFTPGLNLDPQFDGGKRKADSINIEWSNKLGVFVKTVFD